MTRETPVEQVVGDSGGVSNRSDDREVCARHDAPVADEVDHQRAEGLAVSHQRAKPEHTQHEDFEERGCGMAPALQAACASQIFLGSGSPVVLFPLTPALSLGEREKQGSVLGRGWACKANTP